MNLLKRLLGTKKVSIKVSGSTYDGMQFEGQTDCTGSNESELVESCAVQVQKNTGKLLQSVMILECSDCSIVRSGYVINLDRNGKVVSKKWSSQPQLNHENDDDYHDDENDDDYDYDYDEIKS